MTFFIQSGDLFAPTPGKESMLEGLPVGNYIVIETQQGLRFKRVAEFEEPGRMYGNINRRAERILNTFMDRPKTTGVLLAGEKGSGKSQLARNVSRLGYEQNMPTIIVNAPYHGDGFNQLIASIDQPAIILMDEFEKVYFEDEWQQSILTLLDGVINSKKLFILTVNDKWRVNNHMKNRPGRLYYSIEFSGLEPEFVREYCDDNLNDKSQTENVAKIAAIFKAFNFDMLKALVEEMNRYNETAFEAMELLNAKPMETTTETMYEVIATSPSGIVSDAETTTEIPLGSGRGSVAGIVLTFPKVRNDHEKIAKELDLTLEDVQDGYMGKHFSIAGKHISKVDVAAGKYEYEVDGFHVVFTKKPPVNHNIFDIL